MFRTSQRKDFTHTNGPGQAANPEFRLGSYVKDPNGLGCYNVPELLLFVSTAIFKQRLARRVPTLAVTLDSAVPGCRPNVSQSGLSPPQNCT